MGQVPECLSPESRIGYAPSAMVVVENAISLKSLARDKVKICDEPSEVPCELRPLRERHNEFLLQLLVRFPYLEQN